MDPSPFSSPLSSPPETPQSSPTSNAIAQCPTPNQQCACPCEPFQGELKAAVTLMTFVLQPIPGLVTSPYPSDTVTGQHIPLDGLSKYSKSHIWPDSIHCFCSLCPGVEARSVRLAIPPHGPMQSKPCLRCTDWSPDGLAGCRYFVNLADLFQNSESLFGTETIPLRSFPRRVHTQTLLASSRVHISIPDTLPLVRPVKPNDKGLQDYFPYTFRLDGVKPGTVSDPNRIWSPPPPGETFHRVEAMPLPATAEVREVFDEMVNGVGVPYRRLMAVIGGCQVCDQVMTLPNILTHACLGRTKEKGPSPSEHPLLLEDKRALPVAPSHIKRELDGRRIGILADDDVGFADVPIVKRKRKLNPSPPSKPNFAPAMRKPLVTNARSHPKPSSSTQPAEVPTAIYLTDPPIRI